MMARWELEDMRHANTADIFIPCEHHGMLLCRNGSFGEGMEFKDPQGLKKTKLHVKVAQHETDATERLCLNLPLMCDGQRLKSGVFIDVLMFDGLLGDCIIGRGSQRIFMKLTILSWWLDMQSCHARLKEEGMKLTK